MIITKTVPEISKHLNGKRNENRTIGFVPTMGALHKGHLSLINESQNKNDITVCSIYVNPTQFNNNEDFDNYPHTIEEDILLLENLKCDYLFLPTYEEMYPSKTNLSFNFGLLESVMEGKHRPGHFNGVALIVSKFFNIIRPDRAYFGQKDFQQLAIIRKLANDLSFGIKIISCPIIRENNGLAMSSRNERLTKNEREEASKIHKSLNLIKDLYHQKKSIQSIKKNIHEYFENTRIEVEYIEFADSSTLQPIEVADFDREIIVCIAVFLGNVRLIDNMIL